MSAQFPLPLPFLRTQEAARFIGLSYRTLEKYRISGTGPKYSKIGGRIVYAVSDLREWVELGAKRSTSDPATVLPAKPVDKRATKLARGVR
jgi:predicted DNA-binding transcriptional regulator AlpA